MKGILILCLVFGVLAVLLAFSRWLAHRRWAAAGNLLIGVLLFAFVRSFWPAVENLATYHALPVAGPIAQVVCERTGPHAYRVTLTRLPDGHMQLFEMSGDEWRLDVRTVAWRDRAASLGLRPGFRLDRLSSRFVVSTAPVATSAGAGADVALPSSYGLGDREEPGEDIWAQARTGSRWERYLDAQHAYGQWRPLVDDGRFEVWLRKRAAGGGAVLDARAVNEAAGKAMRARDQRSATAQPSSRPARVSPQGGQ